MASNRYVKSIVWLVSFGGIGYVLMEITKPSEEKLAKIRASAAGVQLTEIEKNKLLFLKKLQSPIVGTPSENSKKEATD